MLIVKTRETFNAALFGAALLLCASCVDGPYVPDQSESDATMMLELTIQVRTADYLNDNGTGNGYENYIGVGGGDYGIYFFDLGNRLVSAFVPVEAYTEDRGQYTVYHASGMVDARLAGYSDFKAIMLANWGRYKDADSLVYSQTTIDDLCEGAGDGDTYSTFSAFVDTDGVAAVPSENLLIPFYGVHEYTDVSWGEDVTNLSGSITLLRAVAKVEVLPEDPDLDIGSVVLRRHNARGYCAPSGVYNESDYDSVGADGSFTNTLHLVGGANDTDDKSITMRKTQATDGRSVWYAYIPEYDNATAGSEYAYIQVNLAGEEEDREDMRVYFAKYEDDGDLMTDGDGNPLYPYNISRNCLYSFTIFLWQSRANSQKILPDV